MTEKKTDIICIGQAVVDCITRGAKDYADTPSMQADSITLSAGGDALNEASALASLGYRVELVCGVGDDLAGHIVLSEAKRKGAGTSRISVVPGMRTPIANLMVRNDGSRFSYSSPASKLEGYHPDASSLEGARIISFASLFRAPFDDPARTRSLLLAAHESGACVVADTKLPTFRKCSLGELKDVLPFIDVIFPNEKEAAYYTGESSYDRMAEIFHGYGINKVVIKAGPQGCYASGQGVKQLFPALQVPVVDTTGAGDHFVAGFISGMLSGEDFAGSCKRGLEKAAQCVGHAGASWT